MGVAEMTAGGAGTGPAADGGISVLLADDHALVAEALQVRLAREPDLGPVRVAHTPAQVRASVKQDPPRVLVLDIAFDADGGLPLAQYTRDVSAETRVVVLTAVESVGTVVAALRCGVRAWLPKTVRPEQLIRAIRGVTRGEVWLSPDLLGQVLTAVVGREPGRPDPLAALTPRERDVLQCMVDGLSRAQIAQRLHVSTNTVRTHAQNVLAKLGVHSTLESVALALRHGLRVGGGADHLQKT
jgi:DNA-binding NarL/FixJ family response regulator